MKRKKFWNYTAIFSTLILVLIAICFCALSYSCFLPGMTIPGVIVASIGSLVMAFSFVLLFRATLQGVYPILYVYEHGKPIDDHLMPNVILALQEKGYE